MKDTLARHLIAETGTVRQALRKLDELAMDSVLFLTSASGKLSGALTDGDVRRYLLKGGGMEDPVADAAFSDFKSVRKNQIDVGLLKKYRSEKLRIIPVVDDQGRPVEVINFRLQRAFLPMDAVIMAGGVGSRLRPLTDNVPKPLLKVGEKPIIEHNIDRLRSFGITNLTISIKYLGQQIVDYFGDGADRGMNIHYVTEDEPRGTIGAISEIDSFHNDYVLVMNSDLLTTIDFEEMYLQAVEKMADMTVATVPYEVKIPYGVIETDGDLVTGLQEKPTYTYYSNAGIYILRKEQVAKIPAAGRFGAPDLIEKLYSSDQRVIHFPILGYWLDIGKHHDYEKAQKDIEKLSL
ncbi:MAG: dTDP-glucose pyrophosphorylase [Neolewinella sp.]|jgi:dTDP-glucose pyrophosphorylase